MSAEAGEERRVRSFVRREGRFTPAQRAALANHWTRFGLEQGNAVLDVRALFPQCTGVTLEIGFGMGQTLVELAVREPTSGFIGIEVHRPGVGKLLSLAEQNDLSNLRVFCADAVDVLARTIPDDVLDRVLLFFPDPWPKKRHHKRRIVQPGFVERVRSKLRVGGTFHLATDWQDYAEHMLEVLSAANGWRNAAGPGCFTPRPDSRPLTRFEARGKRLGHGVWDLLFEREA